MVSVGHEGQEEGGPENVLWAVEHAANEYTLLLGNGRDLITVDAAVQFRIRRSARLVLQLAESGRRSTRDRLSGRDANDRRSHARRCPVREPGLDDDANAADGSGGCRRARPGRRGARIHGRRHAPAGCGRHRLSVGRVGGTGQGDGCRQRPGSSKSDGPVRRIGRPGRCQHRPAQKERKL